MLPAKCRLNLKKSYTWVRSGRRFENDLLKVFYRLGQNRRPLIGIATSGAVFKKAHDRNRARRLTAEFFKLIYPSLPISINIVATPKVSVLELTPEQIEQQSLTLKNEICRSIPN